MRRTLILCVQVLGCKQDIWKRSVYCSFGHLDPVEPRGTGRRGMCLCVGGFFLFFLQ